MIGEQGIDSARQASREPIVTELVPPPDASSADRPWGGMTVQLHDWPSGGCVVSPVVDHDIVAMRYTGTVHLVQRRAGKRHQAFVVPGNVTVHSRGFESKWSWDRPGAIVIARIPQYLLCEAADTTFAHSQTEVELKNCFGARDAFVEPIMRLMAQEVQQAPHPVQNLIAESLSCALAGHLVQRFNMRQGAQLSDPAGLDPRALCRVLDYIHANPSGPVTLSLLAKLACVSRFHFARMFRRSTGESPVAYFERTRIARAQELFRSRQHSVAEVAAMLGYADQAHFTRRFRRAVGSTPAVYARHHATNHILGR